MIAINECRITDDGKYLIIEASIENMSYYRDVYIDSVIIDTDKTYQEGGPSYNPVYKQEFKGGNYRVTSDCSCSKLSTEDECSIYTDDEYMTKRVRLILDKSHLPGADLNENIFFVYIVAKGYPAPETPCGMDNNIALAVVCNMRLIYNDAMSYIKELNSDCSMPRGFIDMILRLKAIDISFKTGHYKVAIDNWYKLFKDKKSKTTGRRCGCGAT